MSVDELKGHLAAIGRKGGLKRSKRKAAAARRNLEKARAVELARRKRVREEKEQKLKKALTT